ncbi:MAG: methyltransferase domain-containing protein [Phycisphaeraceae bacterium]|nr:MAG: methyltransferase domain-containing protein [Phycisphaeraceae bacterium]
MEERPDDGWRPFDEVEHQRQLGAVLELVTAAPAHRRMALDLGCGDGRIAKPAAAAGVRVLAIDRDPAALRACGGVEGVVTRQGELLDAATVFTLEGAPAHFGWCLGHTFMQFHDVARAATLMRRLRESMADGSWLAIDNFCDALWADVADGSWQTGISEDGAWQFIWSRGDNTMALRSGDRVDPSNWSIGADDELLRLWSRGELALLAEASGWRGPRPDATGALLLFEKD